MLIITVIGNLLVCLSRFVVCFIEYLILSLANYSNAVVMETSDLLIYGMCLCMHIMGSQYHTWFKVG